MNELLKSLCDYLKENGIIIQEADMPRIFDMYMRIIIGVVYGADIETGLNISFDGKCNLDFSSMDETAISSIKQYITETNMQSFYRISNETLESLLTEHNLVTVFKACQLSIANIVAIEGYAYKNVISHSEPHVTWLINSSYDGSVLMIGVEKGVDEDNFECTRYRFISTSLRRVIPDDVTFL